MIYLTCTDKNNKTVEVRGEDSSGIFVGGRPDDEEIRQHVRTQSDYDLQRALYLSGLQVRTDNNDMIGREPSTTSDNHRPVSSDDEEDAVKDASSGEEIRDDPPIMYMRNGSNEGQDIMDVGSDVVPVGPPGAKRKHASNSVSIDVLKSCYREDFDALLADGRVSIATVPTYQGRVPDSTNGCTVIAPLVCIHHFHNKEEERGAGPKKNGDFQPDPGLPDQVIVDVIDKETPNILPAIRRNLGLVQDAFLIPVDAHESLMEQQYMCPEQFLTVCGGNILEEKHLDPLIEQLSSIGPKKVAATFFFHEHVITILQLKRSPKKVWFDIIDSLPHRETLRRDATSTSGFGSERVLSSSGMSTSSNLGFPSDEKVAEQSLPDMSSSGFLSDEEMADCEGTEEQRQRFLVDSIPYPHNAVRIRCLDAESLKATLRWYACSVFSQENASYIDTYLWDENLTDFDPRVFQAFVWTEA